MIPAPLSTVPVSSRKRRSWDRTAPSEVLRDGETLRVPLMIMDRGAKQNVTDGTIVVDAGCGRIEVDRHAYETALATKRAAYDGFCAALSGVVA